MQIKYTMNIFLFHSATTELQTRKSYSIFKSFLIRTENEKKCYIMLYRTQKAYEQLNLVNAALNNRNLSEQDI